MDFLLLRTFSLMWLIGVLTSAVVLTGLRRTQGDSAYKPWLITSYQAQLLWNAAGLVNSCLRPDLIEPILPFTSIIYDIGFYGFILANTQLAYLFPSSLFERERKWVLRLSIVLGVFFTVVLLWNNFYPHPQGWSFRGFANILASLFNAILTAFGLVTYLRKIRYFRQHNPLMVMPCLLLVGVVIISLGTAFLFVYLGSAHPFVWVFYLFVSTPLTQYMNFILIMYSVFPIRFQDKLIGFAFVSIMTVLLYTNLLLIPTAQTLDDRIAHQSELRTLALIILGSAVFVLWVFPLMLRVSLVKPMQQLLAGIQRADGGDLSVQVAVGTLDEIGTLTQNFNQMTQSLKQSKDELTQYAQTLEEKVADRTARLQQSLADLKAAQTQLIQSEKMASLGELTAGIAHEIQNPLNFVNNFAEVSAELAEELEESVQAGNTSIAVARSTDLRQNMRYIAENGQRASTIIRSMLEHSRSSSGERVPTDLNALAEEYLKLAYHGMRAKDSNFTAKIDIAADPDLGLAEVIPQDIGRVLLNLYNNAFYAVQEQSIRRGEHGMAYQPCVEVSTQQQKGQAIISVKDNGIGIPASIQEKIFQPFFTTKPTGQGTGLGLSLSYDIITKGHNGEMQVESIPGEYTEFILSLPLTSSAGHV